MVRLLQKALKGFQVDGWLRGKGRGNKGPYGFLPIVFDDVASEPGTVGGQT
jgi:hypothetical protein